MLRFLFLAATLSAILVANASAQYQLIRKIYHTKTNTYAEVTCLTGKLPAYGYAPIRITINNGQKTDRSFTLDFTSSDTSSFGNDGGTRLKSSFSCSCAAGSKESYDFMVPLVTIFNSTGYGTNTQLSLELQTSGANDTTTMNTEVHNEWPTVMMSDSLFVSNASRLDSHISGRFSYSGSMEFAGKIKATTMPEDWRGYLGQDALIITDGEWHKLTPGARTALLEWNRMGGKIIIYTTNSSETLASLNISEQAAGSKSIARSHGTVQLRPLPGNKNISTREISKLVDPAAIRSSTEYHSVLHDYAASWPLFRLLEEKHFNTAFFVLILLAFGILVGPVNLFVFAKGGKRHKLFITTPIISLAASLLLILIILFQDGFGGRGHRVMLVEIAPNENKAYITQEQIARTGVLLGSSFEITEEALITPLALSPSRWTRVTLNSRSPASYTANQNSDELNLSGDWFQSRSIHGHLLKTARPTRGRIELSPKAGAPVFTSSFDYDLDEIFYHAPDGNWWRADAIAKGNSVTLIPATAAQFITWLDTQKKHLGRRNADSLHALSKQPNRFFTSSKETPAIETYNSIEWLSTHSIITGELSP